MKKSQVVSMLVVEKNRLHKEIERLRAENKKLKENCKCQVSLSKQESHR